MTLASSYRAVGMVVLALGLSSSASAQDTPKVELSAGYSFLKVEGDVGQTDIGQRFNNGWYAELDGHISRHIAAVFQVSGYYKTFEESFTIGTVSATGTLDIKVHQFMGGVRVSAPTRVSPFGHVLMGAARGSVTAGGSVTSSGQTLLSTSLGDSSTNFALQFGGGVTAWVSNSFGLRGTGDYTRVFNDVTDLDGYRVSAGVVFGF